VTKTARRLCAVNGDAGPTAIFQTTTQAVTAKIPFALVACAGVHICGGRSVAGDALPAASTVVDCRGMGARRDLPQLRGVRGEIVRLDAPDVELRHMLRLLHPRFSVYVVPRAEIGCRRHEHREWLSCLAVLHGRLGSL
jgi:hypothetical protein